jgi:hypothetical protein
MKRILVSYGGQEYTIGDRDLHDVQDEIAAGITSPEPSWLRVNLGEGNPRATDLLLAPGIHIAVTGIAGDDEDEQTSESSL